VSIVGARHATAYGRRVAHQLAGALARAGYTVVSGLARGIDAAAHRGALDAGGRTLAVLGSGVLSVYPPEHAELAVEVARQGAVIGEAPPLASPQPGAFPSRNRIVSGLTLGTVVVEAADRSGALITARLAGEQGREVFAVPGPIDSRMSRGCHKLLRDGARLVESVDDILEELGPLFEPTVAADGREVRSPAELQLGDLERSVLAALDAQVAEAGGGQASVDLDELMAATELAASRVLAAVGVLETRRIVRRLPGNRVARI
jgi:DNA processing protein